MTIVSIGEILWDLIRGEEHLGGAPFNFAAHARRLGHDVVFVSAVGNDLRGRRARARARELGVGDEFIASSTADTGVVTVALGADGQPEFTIHRPAAYDFVELGPAAVSAIAARRPAWICFGTLFQTQAAGRRAVEALIAGIPGALRFYDVNLRRGSWTPALVRELAACADCVKLNDAEAECLAPVLGLADGMAEPFCRSGAERFGWRAACVTRGARGAAVLAGGDYAEADGYAVEVADAVGAGDAFAAAFVHGLSAGWRALEIADFANRLGALVASRPGAAPAWTPDEVAGLMR